MAHYYATFARGLRAGLPAALHTDASSIEDARQQWVRDLGALGYCVLFCALDAELGAGHWLMVGHRGAAAVYRIQEITLQEAL